MDSIVSAFHWLVDLIRDPGKLALAGYPTLALIIFLETGAMIFFLPGDSLLVMAGLYAAQGHLDILYLNALLVPMAILGDATSYFIGARMGPHVFNRRGSRLFRPEHVKAAHDFYEKHGGKAIILARFVPVVRTFVPVIAGVAGMTYRSFATYNVVGGALWVTSMSLTGYVLGTQFPILVKHIEKVIVVVIFLSLLPAIVEWWRAKRRAGAPAASGEQA